MRIKLLKGAKIGGRHGCDMEGDVIEVPDDSGKKYVDAKKAVKTTEPLKVTHPCEGY